MTAFAHIGAALTEIAGCFAFWAWLRLDKSPWWDVPGVASLCLFIYLLTLVEAEHAGRTYAAYGAVYIATALSWRKGLSRIVGICWAPASALLARSSSLQDHGQADVLPTIK